MSKEAIKLLKDVQGLWIELHGEAYFDLNGGQDFDKAIAILESEPEPTKFTKELQDENDKLRKKIDCLTAEIKAQDEDCKICPKAKKAENDRLQIENKRLKEGKDCETASGC